MTNKEKLTQFVNNLITKDFSEAKTVFHDLVIEKTKDELKKRREINKAEKIEDDAQKDVKGIKKLATDADKKLDKAKKIEKMNENDQDKFRSAHQRWEEPPELNDSDEASELQEVEEEFDSILRQLPDGDTKRRLYRSFANARSEYDAGVGYGEHDSLFDNPEKTMRSLLDDAKNELAWLYDPENPNRAIR